MKRARKASEGVRTLPHWTVSPTTICIRPVPSVPVFVGKEDEDMDPSSAAGVEKPVILLFGFRSDFRFVKYQKRFAAAYTDTHKVARRESEFT